MHTVRLTRKAAGAASLDVHAPRKPSDWLAPGAIVPSKFKLLAETSAPVCVKVAFQALLTASSPGNLKVSVQPLMLVLPVLLIVTLAVNAPGHLVAV